MEDPILKFLESHSIGARATEFPDWLPAGESEHSIDLEEPNYVPEDYPEDLHEVWS